MTKLVQIGPISFKLAQTCPNLSKQVQSCSNWFQLVQTCPNLEQNIVRNGPSQTSPSFHTFTLVSSPNKTLAGKKKHFYQRSEAYVLVLSIICHSPLWFDRKNYHSKRFLIFHSGIWAMSILNGQNIFYEGLICSGIKLIYRLPNFLELLIKKNNKEVNKL